MPVEVVDMLRDGLEEIRQDVANLRAQMSEEHRKLGERVAKLEQHQRTLTWVLAPTCLAIGAAIRELLIRWI